MAQRVKIFRKLFRHILLLLRFVIAVRVRVCGCAVAVEVDGVRIGRVGQARGCRSGADAQPSRVFAQHRCRADVAVARGGRAERAARDLAEPRRVAQCV
jgi:hypothetical protein